MLPQKEEEIIGHFPLVIRGFNLEVQQRLNRTIQQVLLFSCLLIS